ncbi:MAG: branched-chain amino acid transaminase [Desulfohalobiaceae bacterium]|nr:branched-chain amino acid transaminase [Desulfohalobiaceae bacterium]
MVQQGGKIWFDGRLIPWEEATVHVMTHTLHYGDGVFEGIRCYYCSDGSSAVFCLEEHVERLFNSAKLLYMEIPFTREEVSSAIMETLKANELKEGYVRPLVFTGDEAKGVDPGGASVHLVIVVWPWGAYLGDEGLDKGIRVKTSSFARHHVNVMMTKSKICGNYVNSVLARREALFDGYDEALMLDTSGFVAEATGENVFIVKNSVLFTPPQEAILPGITRNAVITLSRDMGYEVREERITRDTVYIADEVFVTGTAAEVTPIRELDGRTIGQGSAGPVTHLLQQEFFRVVHGDNLKYAGWLEHFDL